MQEINWIYNVLLFNFFIKLISSKDVGNAVVTIIMNMQLIKIVPYPSTLILDSFTSLFLQKQFFFFLNNTNYIIWYNKRIFGTNV
jgi:hypothetical protein